MCVCVNVCDFRTRAPVFHYPTPKKRSRVVVSRDDDGEREAKVALHEEEHGGAGDAPDHLGKRVTAAGRSVVVHDEHERLQIALAMPVGHHQSLVASILRGHDQPAVPPQQHPKDQQDADLGAEKGKNDSSSFGRE